MSQLFLLSIVVALAAGDTFQPAPYPDVPYCDSCQQGDVVVLVDSKGPLGQYVYDTSLDFISYLFNSNVTSYVRSYCSQSADTGNWTGRVQLGFTMFNDRVWDSKHLCDEHIGNIPNLNSYLQDKKTIVVNGSQSDICGALSNANQLLSQSTQPHAPKSVILFSDGRDQVSSCTQSQATTNANILRNTYNARIMVVAEHRIDTGEVADTTFLSPIASLGDNEQPLLFNLTAPVAIQNSSVEAVANTLQSTFGCCACYGDIVITVQMSDSDDNYATLNPIFNEIWAFMSNISYGQPGHNYKVSLVTFSSHTNTYSRVVPADFACSTDPAAQCTQCSDMTCFQNHVKQYCPYAFPGGTGCQWSSGNKDLTSGLTQTYLATGCIAAPGTSCQEHEDREQAPNVNILFADGDCLSQQAPGDCPPSNYTVQNYQNYFPMILGVFINTTLGLPPTDLRNLIGVSSGRGDYLPMKQGMTGSFAAMLTKQFINDKCNPLVK